MDSPPRSVLPAFGPVAAAGLAVVTLAATRLVRDGITGDRWAVAVLVLLAVAAEVVRVPNVLDDEGFFTTFGVCFTSTLLLVSGWEVAVLAAAVAQFAGEYRAQRSWWKGVYNACSTVLCLTAAGLTVSAIAGLPRSGGAAPFTRALDAVGLVAGAVVLIVANAVVVSLAVARVDRRPYARVLALHRPMVLLESIGLVVGVAPALVVLAERPLVLPVAVVPLAYAYRATRAAAQRRHESTHDLLTGLPNRVRLHQLAGEVVDGARQPAGLVLVEIERVAEVNEALGHSVGDLLLREAGARLAGALDGERTVLGRVGGSTFGVLVDGPNPASAVRSVVLRSRRALAEPIPCGGLAVDVGCRIGYASAPEDADTAEALFGRAHVAVHRARTDGDGVLGYRPDLDADAKGRLALVSGLRSAISTGQLVLHYQPKVRLRDRAVLGLEALVRWRHPERGLLGPGTFVPLVEQTDLATELTAFVIRAALADCATWGRAGLDLTVAVNVPARALRGDELRSMISEALGDAAVPADRLSIELTESTIVEDLDHACDVLGELRAMGISVALDDYGTGQASLAYLDRLPVDELKIDRSFVAAMGADLRSAAIVASTVDLAHGLGLSVVGEGVEHERAERWLQKIGCDLAQGYWYSRPVAADEVRRRAGREWRLAGWGGSQVVP